MSVTSEQIANAVAGLDCWLETMRGPGGYGGPVAHWWQQSLMYTGPGLDWRYEGIIAGYVLLWERTGNAEWLRKARRAGDDLLTGQLANGHFAASGFEINPASAGTPHEAAADVGLLVLARALRDSGQAGWEAYLDCAERNMRMFYLDGLWDPEARSFRDDPAVPSFVPNKAATACDALFLLADLTDNAEWVERYALSTLCAICAHQVRDRGRLNGAIAQNSFGQRRIEKYFPIYIARCVSALLRGYRWSHDEQYAGCAIAALEFICRWVNVDGSLPTVVYPTAHANHYPAWLAPLGDVLRAGDELREHGYAVDLDRVAKRLLSGQDASGGIQTARGFAAQGGGAVPPLPDVRDVLHVSGWCDKAFRYLAAHVTGAVPPSASQSWETICTFRGKTLRLQESPEFLEISDRRGICYHWRKGDTWPQAASAEFWLR